MTTSIKSNASLVRAQGNSVKAWGQSSLLLACSILALITGIAVLGGTREALFILKSVFVGAPAYGILHKLIDSITQISVARAPAAKERSREKREKNVAEERANQSLRVDQTRRDRRDEDIANRSTEKELDYIQPFNHSQVQVVVDQ